MNKAIKTGILWSYVILSLAAFISLIVMGNHILGIAGLVTLNLSVLILGEKDG